MKVVIIAAGMGSRLWGKTNQVPKTLLPFGNGTILSTIIGNFMSIGLHEFVIVVGFESSYILDYVDQQERFDADIVFVDNPRWQRGNGFSVAAAEPAVDDSPFILTMSDHIVSPGALRKIGEHPSAKNLLLVDPRIGDIFDIDDATKVRTDGDDIVAIGKELETYNAIDCGIFRLNDRFFTAMRNAEREGKESISAGVGHLIAAGDMRAVPMDPAHHWIDLDTPESYIHARQQYDEYR
jgi:choline kinase